jgi:hypothetical protein
MNEDANNFESLRRLLALKRHETPPPGYFNDFSSQVVSRIHLTKAGASFNWQERLFDEAPWLVRLLEALQAKPAFTGGFAAALCALLVFGIVYAERPESAPQPLLKSASADTTSFASVSATALANSSGQSLLALNSTNPVMSVSGSSVSSLFDQIQPMAQPVSFLPVKR